MLFCWRFRSQKIRKMEKAKNLKFVGGGVQVEENISSQEDKVIGLGGQSEVVHKEVVYRFYNMWRVKCVNTNIVIR
jgi:hypothetical protein